MSVTLRNADVVTKNPFFRAAYTYILSSLRFASVCVRKAFQEVQSGHFSILLHIQFGFDIWEFHSPLLKLLNESYRNLFCIKFVMVHTSINLTDTTVKSSVICVIGLDRGKINFHTEQFLRYLILASEIKNRRFNLAHVNFEIKCSKHKIHTNYLLSFYQNFILIFN